LGEILEYEKYVADAYVQIGFATEALADIARIHAFLSEFNPRAADRIAAKLINQARALKVFPRRGRLHKDGYRELVAVYPYVMAYDVSDTRVEILRIWHGAQHRP
jgi:addiction module RelE/StbE family toxin